MTAPNHLQPIEPASVVLALCERIATEVPASQYGVADEFYAFLETARHTTAAGWRTRCAMC
jgi:hypothetical protein